MTLSVLDLVRDVHRHGACLMADVDRGVLCLEGWVCSGLWKALRAQQPQLLAVLSRFQQMTEHDDGHDRPPTPMVHWPAAYGPGHCQSCGHVLDHPRAVGRCDACHAAAELFHRTRDAGRHREFVHRVQRHDKQQPD